MTTSIRSVRLDDDTWRSLSQIADATERPASWHIRRAIDRYVATHDPVGANQTTRVQASPGTGASSVGPRPPRLGASVRTGVNAPPTSLPPVGTEFRPAPKPAAKPKSKGLRRG